MGTIFEWTGKLDPTHDLSWLTHYVVHHHGVPPRDESATVDRDDNAWQIPTADNDPEGVWVTITGPDAVAIRRLGGKRVKITIEEVDEPPTARRMMGGQMTDVPMTNYRRR